MGTEISKDLIAASSTPIVLAILAEGDSYGYAILQRVRDVSGGRLEWTDGMLYPVLHRLARIIHEVLPAAASECVAGASAPAPSLWRVHGRPHARRAPCGVAPWAVGGVDRTHVSRGGDE
jgi:hypothetical protein